VTDICAMFRSNPYNKYGDIASVRHTKWVFTGNAQTDGRTDRQPENTMLST